MMIEELSEIFEKSGITNPKIREGIEEAWTKLNIAGVHVSVQSLINMVQTPQWIFSDESKCPSCERIIKESKK